MESNLDLASDVGREIVDAAGAPLVELGPLAYTAGVTLGERFHAGMRVYIGAIRDTSIELGDAASSGFRLESPAPEGPLSNPGVMGGWGEQLGKNFAQGMRESIPFVQSASLALGAAAVPDVDLANPVGGGTAGPLSPISGVTQVFNLQWSGAPPEGKSETEIVRNLQRLLPIARGY